MDFREWVHVTLFCFLVSMPCANGGVRRDNSFECPSLTRLKNGEIRNYGRNLGRVLTFTCNKGYMLHGGPSIKCQLHQYGLYMWSNSQPTCKKVKNYCQVKHTSFGMCSPKDSSIDSYRTCQCNDGYVLRGHARALCQLNKQWSYPLPQCQESCPQNEKFNHGSCRYEKVAATEGWKRTCGCDHGFTVVGNSTATCKQSADWSSALPTCTACPDLSGPDNGVVVINKTNTTRVAYYYCHPGYVLNGTQNVTCQFQFGSEMSHWLDSPPICQPKSCPSLSPPQFGSLNIYNNISIYNQSVTYYCNKGYHLITRNGLRTRRCLNTGRWSGWAPFCQHVCVAGASKCRTTEECIVDSTGQDRCQCIDVSNCPSELKPVCGSNGKEYNNKCLMKLKSCSEGKHNTTVVAQGNCAFGGVCSSGRPQPTNGAFCRAYLYRYWYNSTSQKCESYVYGGCYEGKNSFYTIQDCKQTCIKDDVCKLDFDGGKCNFLNETKWFFNKTSHRCESFQYGGCFGNENHFSSEKLCEVKCLNTNTEATKQPMTDQSTTEKPCVCTSPVNRSEAMTRFDSVCLVRITSFRKQVNSDVQHNAKFNETCVNSEKNITVNAGEKLTIVVREVTQNGGGCVCPVFVKGKTYRVGLRKITASDGGLRKITASDGGLQFKVPRQFFVEAV